MINPVLANGLYIRKAILMEHKPAFKKKSSKVFVILKNCMFFQLYVGNLWSKIFSFRQLKSSVFFGSLLVNGGHIKKLHNGSIVPFI